MQTVGIVNVTILNGQAISGSGPLYSASQILGLVFPAAWTAATAGLQVSLDGSVWKDVFIGSTELSLGAGANQVAMLTTPVSGFPLVRVRSGSIATPVNQLANRDIGILVRQD